VRRRWFAIVVLLVCAAGCSLPATTFEAYRSKAADAAQEVVSQARTAILTAHLAGQDRLLGSEVAAQLKNAETAAAAVVESFASVQPPDARADHLRARILPLLERASDAITRMRFEAKRGHTAALLQLRSSLIEPTDVLERWAGSNA
jgi:cellobiose-specific phosphotransferase system component IIA